MPSLKIDIITDAQGAITGINQATAAIQQLDAAITRASATAAGYKSIISQTAASSKQFSDSVSGFNTASTGHISAITRAAQAHTGLGESTKKATSHMDTHSFSMTGAIKNILALYAAWYVGSTAVQAFASAIFGTMKIIDDYNGSIVKMAAITTSMMEVKPGNSLADNYKEAYKWAELSARKVEELDKFTALSVKEINMVLLEAKKQGMDVDWYNEKEVQGFLSYLNAVSTFTQGAANKELQLRQETKALIKGETKASDELALSIAATTENFKEQNELHKQSKDYWEWMGTRTTGFAAAQKDINALWETAKSNLQEIAFRVLRDGFGEAYRDIIGYTHQLTTWAERHKGELIEILQGAWIEIRNTVKEVKDTMAAFGLPDNLFEGLRTVAADLRRIVILLQEAGILAMQFSEGFNNVVNYTFFLGQMKPLKEGAATAKSNRELLEGRRNENEAVLMDMAQRAQKRQRVAPEILNTLSVSPMDAGFIPATTPHGQTLWYDKIPEKTGPERVPKPNTRTVGKEGAGGSAGKSGQDWLDIQRQLTAELDKSAVEASKWDKELIDIDKKYADIMDKAKGGTKVDKGFMDKWRTEMKANVHEDWLKEVAKINAKGEEEERKTQYKTTMLYLAGENERFNIVKKNQIDIAKVRAAMGIGTERGYLEDEQGFQLNELYQQREDAQREFDFIGSQPGSMTSDSLEKQVTLWNKIEKITTQIGTTREYFGVQLADKEYKSTMQTYELLKQVYSYLPGAAEEYYNIELALIERKADQLRSQLKWTEEQAEKDIARQRENAEIEIAIQKHVMVEKQKARLADAKLSDNFFVGVTAQWEDLSRTQMKWGQAGTKVVSDFTTASASSISSGLFDVITGEADALEKAWESLWQSMLKTMTDIIGQMVVRYAMFGAAGLEAPTGGNGQQSSIPVNAGGIFGAGKEIWKWFTGDTAKEATSTVSAAGDFAGSLNYTGTNAISETGDQFKDIVTLAGSEFKGSVEGSGSFLSDIFGGLKDSLSSIVSAIGGLFSGDSSSSGNVSGWVGTLGKAALDWYSGTPTEAAAGTAGAAGAVTLNNQGGGEGNSGTIFGNANQLYKGGSLLYNVYNNLILGGGSSSMYAGGIGGSGSGGFSESLSTGEELTGSAAAAEYAAMMGEVGPEFYEAANIGAWAGAGADAGVGAGVEVAAEAATEATSVVPVIGWIIRAVIAARQIIGQFETIGGHKGSIGQDAANMVQFMGETGYGVGLKSDFSGFGLENPEKALGDYIKIMGLGGGLAPLLPYMGAGELQFGWFDDQMDRIGLGGMFNHDTYHEGGTVGEGSHRQTRVSPLAFLNAPNLSGLRNDEQAVIVQKGETITPKGGGKSFQTTQNVTINAQIATTDNAANWLVKTLKAAKTQRVGQSYMVENPMMAGLSLTRLTGA